MGTGSENEYMSPTTLLLLKIVGNKYHMYMHVDITIYF